MCLSGLKYPLNNPGARDASVFERYFTKDYVVTAPDGTVMGKVGDIGLTKSGAPKFESSR